MTTITDRIEHGPSATYTHPSSPLSLWATVGRVLGNFAAMLLDWQERARQQARLLSQQSHLVCAIAQARAEKASLIVARLDRLTRSTAGLALILECGPKLLVVETPNARPFVLQIYAAAAEEYPMRTPTRL